ncbi:MAG: amidohydrolase [Candidatus Tectomicrobia bacterium]|nr:amidohydrolase [Candidatus Tectomicrobia bacterium]
MSKPEKLIIEGGYVVTMNPSREVFEEGYVAVQGQRISAVGPLAGLKPKARDGKVIDARGMIVIPGLINAHQHFYYHLFKGLANGLLIEDWFPALVFPVLPHLTDDDMELTSYLAGIEMLRTGTTCCLHHLRTTTTGETLEKIAGPAAELGFRQVIGKEVQCRLPGNPNHPRDLDEEIAYIDGLIPQWNGAHKGLIRLALVTECNSNFIHQQVTSEELLAEGKKLADKHGLKISTHYAAGTLSFEKSYLQVLRKTGRTDVQNLMQLGLLDPAYILAHGINATETDIRLMAESGCSSVYTPTSEAVRGGGIGPAVPMVRAGVNVALGSDGPMVDYSVDMVEQMKACSFLQNAKHLDPTAMPPEQCLEMATLNAAKALGLDREIGSLEAGKLADVAVFDLRKAHSTVAHNPISSLVYSAKGTDVHTLLVDGRAVIEDGNLKSFSDEEEVIRAATARGKEIVEKAGLKARATPRWPKRG